MRNMTPDIQTANSAKPHSYSEDFEDDESTERSCRGMGEDQKRAGGREGYDAPAAAKSPAAGGNPIEHKFHTEAANSWLTRDHDPAPE
jgi:hypothetical protein